MCANAIILWRKNSQTKKRKSDFHVKKTNKDDTRLAIQTRYRLWSIFPWRIHTGPSKHKKLFIVFVFIIIFGCVCVLKFIQWNEKWNDVEEAKNVFYRSYTTTGAIWQWISATWILFDATQTGQNWCDDEIFYTWHSLSIRMYIQTAKFDYDFHERAFEWKRK